MRQSNGNKLLFFSVAQHQMMILLSHALAVRMIQQEGMTDVQNSEHILIDSPARSFKPHHKTVE